MTDINASIREGRKAGVRRMKKHVPRIDMTPMVDLGFLLISFFVITTELSKPKAMDLFMPKEGPPSDLCNSCALTILLDNDRIFCYEGDWEIARTANTIEEITFSGKEDIRSIISAKQDKLDNNPLIKEGRKDLMMLIKPGQQANYKNVVDVLDEATITMVKKYALLKLSPGEKQWLENYHR